MLRKKKSGPRSGPSTWARSFNGCAGKQQSPIDIVRFAVEPAAAKAPLAVAFKPATRGSLKIFNDGHTVQVQGAGLKGSSTQLDGVSYALQHFHFHRLSETTVDGKHMPLEAQFVHKASDGSIMVVAVLFQTGLGPIDKLPWKGLIPADGKKPLLAFNPAAILPAKRDYFFYHGSSTTPPCTEGVKWAVLRAYQSMTAAHAAAFPFSGNFRPVQPLNGRDVLLNGVRLTTATPTKLPPPPKPTKPAQVNPLPQHHTTPPPPQASK